MVIALLTTDNRENFRQYEKPAPWFGTAPEALMQGFAALAGVTVHVVSCAQQPMPMPAPAQLAPNIFFHSLHVPKSGWLRAGYQGCIRAVRRKLREIGPDIVHGQGTERDCAISAVFSGFPNVLTIHGNMRLIAAVNHAKPFSYQWLAAKLEAFTVPRSQGVVCITRYTERAVAGLARRTWVAHNAVDKTFFDVPRARESPPVLLCVGNIQHRKNQNAYIRALDPLAAQHAFRLVFLGPADAPDDYTREFRALVAERPWCEHAGPVGRAELKQRLSRAAALALPSLEDNCPMVVIEAMAAGVPVVAAKVGGVPELVTHGVTGLLCDPGDADSMREQTRDVLTRPEFAGALAREGAAAARERFHPEAIARRHVEIYESVLSRSG